MDKQRLVLLKNVCKEFDGVEVLSNINLYIRKNEFLTLLGPSGCGKTTLLCLCFILGQLSFGKGMKMKHRNAKESCGFGM